MDQALGQLSLLCINIFSWAWWVLGAAEAEMPSSEGDLPHDVLHPPSALLVSYRLPVSYRKLKGMSV